MNITAINTLADLLENIPPETRQGFNMRSYFRELGSIGPIAGDDYNNINVGHQCGTVACIAGWGSQYLKKDGSGLLKEARPRLKVKALAFNYDDFDDDRESYYEGVARRIMGLDEEQALILFEPMSYYDSDTEIEWGNIKPEQAAKVLRHLAQTGEVDWKVAFK